MRRTMLIELLLKVVIACFFGTWIVLGIVSVYLFWIKKDVALKRKWFPRFVVLAGVLFVLFSSTIMVLQSRSFQSLGILAIVIPFVILASYLNLKFTKFCGKCGATIIDYNWFSPMKFCSKCGAELDVAREPR